MIGHEADRNAELIAAVGSRPYRWKARVHRGVLVEGWWADGKLVALRRTYGDGGACTVRTFR